MHRCCVFGCKNVGIHLFPKDKKIRKQWETAVRVKNFKAANHSRLCTAHFKPEDYQKEGFYTGLQNSRRILKKGVVPSLFVWSKKESFAAEQRRKRTENRDARKRLALQVTKRETESSNDKSAKKSTAVPDIYDHVEKIVAITEECVAYEPNNVLLSTHDIGTQKDFHFFTTENFRANDKAILFFTGLESFDKFMFVFSTLCPEVYSLKNKLNQVPNISAEDQFFLTLIKLKQDKEDYELGLLFNISTSSVSDVFITWIKFLYQMWKKLDESPNNCSEIPLEDPERLGPQQAVQDSCKSQTSAKFDNGTFQTGLLHPCSKAYSDNKEKQIVEEGLLLKSCIKKESIISNCCFNVQDKYTSKEAAVDTSLLNKRSHMVRLTFSQDGKLAFKCLHREQLTKLKRIYHFLKSPIDNKYVPLISKVYFVCQMLNNLKEGILQESG